MVDWHKISRPYECGGWDIKNLEWFSLALRFKILWLILNGNGLWTTIIKFKYLKNKQVDEWIFSVQGTSFFWNNFIRAISWLTRFLGWKASNGHKIKIGIDPIVGLNSDYMLPLELRAYLVDYGISHLSYAQNWGIVSVSQSYWLTVDDLELAGQWKVSWNNI